VSYMLHYEVYTSANRCSGVEAVSLSLPCVQTVYILGNHFGECKRVCAGHESVL
jgi:hypothetical protein